MRSFWKPAFLMLLLVALLTAATLGAQTTQYEYKVLATTKTSTLEKELNEAAREGYRVKAVMGGETAALGDEAVVVMVREAGATQAEAAIYKLLATQRTSTMEDELNDAGQEGFDYIGQTVFKTAFGGREVVVILERVPGSNTIRVDYRLQSTKKTSTMEDELRQVGEQGYELVGLTVAKTAFGGVGAGQHFAQVFRIATILLPGGLCNSI